MSGRRNVERRSRLAALGATRCATLGAILGALVFLASCAAPCAAAELTANLRFERLTTDDGLAHNTVEAIAQDRTGFLWFGTHAGLDRYDGHEFRHVRHTPTESPTLETEYVSHLTLDGEGRLWVANWSGGLSEVEPRTGGLVRHLDTLLDGQRIHALLFDREGTLWAGTTAGLARLVDGESADGGTRLEAVAVPSAEESPVRASVWAMTRDGDGYFWVGTDTGLAFLRREELDKPDAVFTVLRHDPDDENSLSHDSVSVVFADRAGTVWVGTADGLNRRVFGTTSFVRYEADAADPSKLASGEITALYEDSRGRFWVGTRGGLHLMDREKGTFQRFRHDPQDPASLPHDDVRAILEDRSQILWIATRGGGVAKLDLKPRKFLHLRHDPASPASLLSGQVRRFAEDDRGRLWIGTADGLDRWDEEACAFIHDRPASGREERTAPPNGATSSSLPVAPVSFLAADGRGALWTAAWWGGGVHRLDPAATEARPWRTYRHDPEDPSSLPDDKVLALYADHRGDLLVVTRFGLARQENGGGQRWELHVPLDLQETHTAVLHEDAAGTLWLGTNSEGLVRVDRATGSVQRFQHVPGDDTSLSNDSVFALESTAGRLWVGTLSGLDELLEDGTFKHHLPEQHGPVPQAPSDTSTEHRPPGAVLVKNVLRDDQDRLWLTTGSGLTRFDPRAGTFRHYDVQDGLQGRQFFGGAALRRRNGDLCFGGDNGFNTFDPGQVRDNSLAPPVVVTRVLSYDRPVHWQGEEILEFDHTQDFISFEFSALDYTNPRDHQFRYRLQNTGSLRDEEEWIDAGTRRFASYTDLPPGEYTFQVMGSNSDGVWSEVPASVRLRVVPPWWRRPWVSVLAAFLVVLFVAGGAHWRDRRHRHREEVLQQRINESIEDLQRSERRYRLLFERNLVGVVRASLDGRILECNDAFARLFGYTSSTECRARHRLALGPSVEDHERFLDRLHDEGMVGSYETHETTRDGSQVTLLWNANLAQDGTGTGLEIVVEGTVIDLSEHRMLEERVRQGHKLESLGVLAGGIAHDFNNLLVGILGNAELARMDLDNSSPILEYVDEIESAANRARILSQKMLAYSGKGRFITKPVDLTETVEELRPLIGGSVDKRISVEYRLANHLPHVRADPAQLNQVVVNLVTNAAEALSDKGEASGRVVVSTSVEACDRATFEQAYFADDKLVEGDYVTLEVRDDGAGMDAETLGKVFDPFFTTRFPGRGLGLPVVLGIVRGHHGAIQVHSAPGEGTAVRVYLPIVEAPVEAPAPVVHGEEEWRGSGRVLIIDDEEVVRKIGSQMVELLGFESITAVDGLDGVEVFEKHADSIVLVLLDLTMPRMSGEEALHHLRRIRPDVRVLIVSGYDEQETLRRFGGQPFSGFLQKPYRMAALKEKMRAALEGDVFGASQGVR